MPFTHPTHHIVLLCPVLTPPENGDVFVSGQTVNSIATYICNEGFLSELLVRSCLDNGEWSGFDPMCLSMSKLTSSYIAVFIA